MFNRNSLAGGEKLLHFEKMADILRKNCVALIGTLRKQEYLCDLLVSRRVLSEEDRDEVLCEKTNSRKNRLLLDLIRCRFTRAFPVFCEGLRTTQQFDLLQLLDPARAFDNVPEEPNRSTECKICVDYQISIAFQPCQHACCCQECARQVNSCPICRSEIDRSITIFL